MPVRRNTMNEELICDHGEITDGIGLFIRTVAGDEFEVHGKVTHKDFLVAGKIYYCGFWSYPEKIVVKVLTK